MDLPEPIAALPPMNDRERRLWRVWLGCVSVLVIGALIWTAWLMLVWQPPTTHHGRGVQAQRGSTSSPAAPSPAVASLQPTPFSPVGRRAPGASPDAVWVNTRSHIYHFPGYRWYGTTIQGKYTSEQEATAEGDRAALNERRPTNFGARVLP